MSLGPIMFDLEGTEITSEEASLLQHPAAGGIILFTRNYHHPDQLKKLIHSIREVRPELLIAVDHEGGRVQRFRQHFTALPSARKLGKTYDQNPQMGKLYAETAGWMMAAELRQYDIDFSFAPVLDIDISHNDVIGSRAFHADPYIVSELAASFIRGMHRAGMNAVGKHFPGHGFVQEDSHFELPYDLRSLSQLEACDLIPFQRLIQCDLLAGVMPAHVVYSKVAEEPAGFSSYWLKTLLREKLNFTGVIFSDSLTMLGADNMGGYDERAQKALQAGCDMILVCNNRLATLTILEALSSYSRPDLTASLLQMRRESEENITHLHKEASWREGVALLSTLIGG